MKRRILIPVLLLFVVSVSCKFLSNAVSPSKPVVPTAASNPVVAAPTETAPEVEEEQPTESVAEDPTAEPEEPTAEVAATEEATVEPSAEPTEESSGPQPFTEKFDNGTPDGWKFFYIAGTERGNKIVVEDGVLRYQINTKETYAYVENENQVYKDVIVTTSVKNTGDNNNGIAVACRISDAGWYEFRINIATSSIYLYRYDQAKKDKKQNPYVELVPQHVVKEINPGFKINKLSLSCIGNEIRIFINDTELIYDNEFVTDDLYTEGFVGVGGMSYTTSNYAVKLDFDEVSAELPK